MSGLREEVPVSDALPPRWERRRAGRTESLSPTLIPLLRGQVRPPCDDEVLREPDLAAATGIAVSVVLSGLILFTIGSIIHLG